MGLGTVTALQRSRRTTERKRKRKNGWRGCRSFCGPVQVR